MLLQIRADRPYSGDKLATLAIISARRGDLVQVRKACFSLALSFTHGRKFAGLDSVATIK